MNKSTNFEIISLFLIKKNVVITRNFRKFLKSRKELKKTYKQLKINVKKFIFSNV